MNVFAAFLISLQSYAYVHLFSFYSLPMVYVVQKQLDTLMHVTGKNGVGKLSECMSKNLSGCPSQFISMMVRLIVSFPGYKVLGY